MMNLGRVRVPKFTPRWNSLWRMNPKAFAFDIHHEGFSFPCIFWNSNIKGALIFGQRWQIGAVDRRRIRANQRAAFGVVFGAGISHGLVSRRVLRSIPFLPDLLGGSLPEIILLLTFSLLLAGESSRFVRAKSSLASALC